MSYFPLLTGAFLASEGAHGILKGGLNKILGVWYNRSFELTGEPQDYSFAQDLDIGETTGQFRRLYRKWGYRRYMSRISEASMPMLAITDKPAKNILTEFSTDSIYRNNRLIVTNGGACVYALVDPTKTNINERYKNLMPEDTKISKEATEDLRSIIEAVSTNVGKRNMPYGAFVVSTKESRNVYAPEKTSLFARARIAAGLKRSHIIPTQIEDDVLNNAKNISFEIFPKFSISSGLASKRTSFENIGKKLFNYKLDSKDESFLARWLRSRFIPYIGFRDPDYQPTERQIQRMQARGPRPRRHTNLPTLRNLIWRHKNTYVDCLNQFDIVRSTLVALVKFDKGTASNPIPPEYINEDVCVTLSTKGLEFVPKGCSKIGALWMAEPQEPIRPQASANLSSLPQQFQQAYNAQLNQWQQDHQKWQTEHREWQIAIANPSVMTAYGAKKLKNTIINGDNYNDFLMPVPIKKLKEEFELACANSNGAPVDILDIFYKLSKPPQGLTFNDVNEMAIRYNVTGNTLSGIAIDIKTAEGAQWQALRAETKTLVKDKKKAFDDTENNLNRQLTELNNLLNSNRITGADYTAQKSAIEQKLNENTEKRNKFNQDLPNIIQRQKDKAKVLKATLAKNPLQVPVTAEKGEITEYFPGNPAHNARSGKDVLDRVQEKVKPISR